MAQYRFDENEGFTVLGNSFLQDRTITNKARGLLALMLSLPDQWVYTISGLAAICKDGRDSIRMQMEELEEHGYVTRRRVRGEHGRLGSMEYEVRCKPVMEAEKLPENPVAVLHQSDIPTEKQPILENSTL